MIQNLKSTFHWTGYTQCDTAVRFLIFYIEPIKVNSFQVLYVTMFVSGIIK